MNVLEDTLNEIYNNFQNLNNQINNKNVSLENLENVIQSLDKYDNQLKHIYNMINSINNIKDHLKLLYSNKLTNIKNMSIKNTPEDNFNFDYTIDLVNVTKIEPNSEVCFVDDMLHTRMQLKNIFYIHVLPYIAFLPVDVMIERVLKSEFGKQHINPLEHSHFASIVKLHMGDIKELHDLHSNSSFISMYNRTSTINKLSEFKGAGKKLLSYIKYFFKYNTTITSMSSRKSSTVKKRYKKKVKWCTKRRFP